MSRSFELNNQNWMKLKFLGFYLFFLSGSLLFFFFSVLTGTTRSSATSATTWNEIENKFISAQANNTTSKQNFQFISHESARYEKEAKREWSKTSSLLARSSRSSQPSIAAPVLHCIRKKINNNKKISAQYGCERVPNKVRQVVFLLEIDWLLATSENNVTVGSERRPGDSASKGTHGGGMRNVVGMECRLQTPSHLSLSPIDSANLRHLWDDQRRQFEINTEKYYCEKKRIRNSSSRATSESCCSFLSCRCRRRSHLRNV